MRYLLLSDIHGSLPRLDRVLAFYERGRYDMLLLLGDILNYGPRNRVPEGLDARGVADRLNSLASQVMAVRGNCDSEVDQMLLRFPILADYALLVDEGRRVFLTHGHVYNPGHLPPGAFDAVVCGHTHLWELRLAPEAGAPLLCNIGSPTFPKEGRPPTFGTLEDGTLFVRSLDGGVLASAAVGH